MLLFRFSCSLLPWKFFELPSNRVLSSNYWVAASTNLRSMPMMVHRFICRTTHACLPLCLPNTNLVDTLVELGVPSPAQPQPTPGCFRPHGGATFPIIFHMFQPVCCVTSCFCSMFCSIFTYFSRFSTFCCLFLVVPRVELSRNLDFSVR